MRQALAGPVALALVATVAGCSRTPTSSETLYILGARDVEGLDPHTSGGLFQTQTVLANVYEGLVTLNAETALVPALAVSWSNPTIGRGTSSARGTPRSSSTSGRIPGIRAAATASSTSPSRRARCPGWIGRSRRPGASCILPRA